MTVNFKAKFYPVKRLRRNKEKRSLLFTYEGQAEVDSQDLSRLVERLLYKKIDLKGFPFSFNIKLYARRQNLFYLDADIEMDHIEMLHRLGAERRNFGFKENGILIQWQPEFPVVAAAS